MNKILDPYQAAKLNYLEAFIAAHTENEFEIYTLKTNFIFTRHSKDNENFVIKKISLKRISRSDFQITRMACTEENVAKIVFEELRSGEELFFNGRRKKMIAPVSFIVKALTDIPDYVKKKQFIYIIDDSISPFKGE